jgi:hypothetical protein
MNAPAPMGTNNTVTGYRQELSIDLALHPGTVLTGNE